MAKYILVVDDAVTIRASVEYVLKQVGYEVTLANDGVDAITKLKAISQAGQDISMIIIMDPKNWTVFVSELF